MNDSVKKPTRGFLSVDAELRGRVVERLVREIMRVPVLEWGREIGRMAKATKVPRRALVEAVNAQFEIMREKAGEAAGGAE